MSGRPNILLVTSDQHRHDCLGFAGRKVRTPHLDRLAESGTVFETCITPNVICQPARASLLTGLLPLTHGVHDNGIDLPDETGSNGMAGSLAAAGYATAYIGKAHFKTIYTFLPTHSPECQQSMGEYAADWHGPYMGFDHVELVVEGHNRHPPAVPPSGQHYENWFYLDGLGDYKNALHRTKLPPDSGAPQTWNSALPPVWHNSTWVADRTIDYLDNRRTDDPFLLWMSFPDPHSPFDCPAPWCFLHHPDDVDLPNVRDLDVGNRPWWHRANLEIPDVFADPRLSSLKAVRERLSKKPPGYSRLAPTDDSQLRHVIANYYGMISLIDHSVGRVLARLTDLGLSDSTIVIFTSDHGEWLGDHGLIQKGPMMYRGLLQVPLIVAGPSIPAGGRHANPVSLIDIAPTMLDLAGASPLQDMHGASLARAWRGEATGEYALNEWELEPWRYGVDRALSLRTVRSAKYRLTIDLLSNEGELYDLADDPDEMVNRFDDPAFLSIRNEHLDMIRARPDDRLDLPLPRAGL